MATEVAFFPGIFKERVEEVGGKGFSLIKMSASGLPVPPGFVLKVQFFRSWLDELEATDEWKLFVASDDENAANACARLKQRANDLQLSAHQREVLDEALARLPSRQLYAVRSSSPEEDLAGFSFAGAYETVLGVTLTELDNAIRRSFQSCLDYQIVSYKKKHGFDWHNPKIAVIVQEQLESEIAGVGFSLNPLTNDFDEAVITANFGLGESVVAGVVTPDAFVVDKLKRTIIERTRGTKEKTVRLKRDGGTQIHDNEGGEFSLTDRQVRKVLELVKDAEKVYACPIDIEWAFEKEKLYLLQARPITAYQPLPPDMMTRPGERRMLYIDATKAVQGIFDPLSVMGASVLKQLMRKAMKKLYGIELSEKVRDTVGYVSGGHLYLNLSSAFRVLGKERMTNALRILDPLAADAAASLDDKKYVSDNYMLYLTVARMLSLVPRIAPRMMYAYRRPEKAYDELASKIETYRDRLGEIKGSTLPFPHVVDKAIQIMIDLLLQSLIPSFGMSRLAIEEIKKVVDADQKELANRLNRSLPHNVTVEMGLSLFDLARQVPEGMSADELIVRLNKRTLDRAFLKDWDEFIRLYGHRGSRELDIATPRYDEDYAFIARQLVALRDAGEELSPRQRYEKSIEERKDAYERISNVLSQESARRLKRFERLHKVVLNLGGLRETPKYCVMMATKALRSCLLNLGEKWTAEGRLDLREDIFNITIEEVAQAQKDKSFDIRASALRHKAEREKYRVATLPKMFDSRGRFIRPPMKTAAKDEIVGTPISAGVAAGAVKVLHHPDEKPLLPGEVMVARATDPGWTPLFAVAGAVVLEVGGVLQHGALVAREYGLPCVSGVDNATERLADGMRVEVNGTDGVVKLLPR